MAKKKGKRRGQQPAYRREISDDSFEKLLNETFVPVRQLEMGVEQEGTVIGIDNDHVYLDLGTRLDGMIRKQELIADGKVSVKEGDKVKVYVTGQRSGIWQCTCRLLPDEGGIRPQRDQDPKKVASLMALEDAYQQNSNVDAKVIAVTKGGFEVQVIGLKAFCPLSQIDTQYCDHPEAHVDKIYPVKIIQFGEGGTNIVVSRKEYLEHEAKKKADKLWQQVQEGGIYEGTVSAVRDYGAFVNIGGIEGLLHISEISYERIERAGDKLKVGQKLEVAVKEINRENRKLSLSLKLLQEDPWREAVKILKTGGEFQGKVVRMKTYGAFIELFPGVDGMVHISRLGSDRPHRHPKEILNIGDMVAVRVLEIDEENRKISLTMEKEEGDYSKDLEQLKTDQEAAAKSTPGQMSELVTQAVNENNPLIEDKE